MDKLNVQRKSDQLEVSIPQLQSSQVWLYCSPSPNPNSEKSVVGKRQVTSEERVVIDKKNDTQRLYFYLEDGDRKYVGAERKVNVKNLYNCRDLGGYETTDNRLTKWGQIFRSDALHEISSEDILYLEKLGIQTIVDFRSPAEISKNPNKLFGNTTYFNFNPHADIAQQASTSAISKKDEDRIRQLEQMVSTLEGKDSLKKNCNIMVSQMRGLVLKDNAIKAYQNFFATLLNEKNKQLIFHCQGGKDRTGWAAALFLASLGVSKATIYTDYLLTEEMNVERNQKRMAIYKTYTDNSEVLAFLASMQQTKESYLDGAFRAVEERYGEIDNYLKQALQLENKHIQKLKDQFLYSS